MQEQSMAIVKSLVSVAWADGEFHDKEREMVEGLIAAFEASEEQAKEIRAYAAERKTLDDVPLGELGGDDRRTLLQHAVLLTFVDGEQHDAEKQYIAALCKKLEIPELESEQIIKSAEARARRLLTLL
ncbi:TerB family tellurite resistance protein [Sorangium sp. So ce1078]|uniref:TerB family tellurite resistance protein n=1 Tax=Sorangium sp. So ce1078 TaxID=3133329 RepID=UPI003F601329